MVLRHTVPVAVAVGLTAFTLVPARARDGFDAARLAAIRPALQNAIDEGELAGVVTLVWRQGQVAQVNALGARDLERQLPMEAHTIFQIASMSKPVTSVAALMLIEEGTLSLADPIARWVPEFTAMRVLRRPDGPLHDTYPAPRGITVEDLLTHRSGLVYPYTASGPLAAALEAAIGSEIHSRLEPDAWLAALAKLPLAHAPGERFHYGVSTSLLGFVAARAAGLPLRELLTTRLFQPLRMTDTDFWIPPAKRDRAAVTYAPAGAGAFRRLGIMPGFIGAAPPTFTSGGEGLVTTARDFLTFARLLLNRGHVGGVRLLKPGTIEMMTANRLTPGQRRIPVFGLPMWRTMGFGLGVSVVTDAAAYTAAGAGAASNGAFGWPGAFGGWWQADPAENLVAIFLPQMRSAHAPVLNSAQSPEQMVPAAASMRAFQRMVYAAIAR